MASKVPTKTQLLESLGKQSKFFDQLAARWADEKEHEDFATFTAAVTKKFPSCSKGTKSPFAFYFTIPEGVAKVQVTKTEVKVSFTDAKPEAAKPKETKAKPEAAKPAKVNCSTVARELILEGKSNAEVWAVIKDQFNLDDKKKGYPAWYRMDLKRKGLLHA